MADNKLEQMLEHLVNDEQDKAEELFHEYVVAKSREIYEGLVEDQWDEEEVAEADDDMMGGDATDDLEDEITADDEDEMDMDDEEGEESEEELFQDLEDIVDELQAKFDELKGGDDDDDEMDMDDDEEMDMGDDDEEIKDDFDVELATVREYVEKINGGAASSETTADNKKSVVDNMKNDMGGTTANILGNNTDEKGRSAPTAKEENMGNVNVPGGKASKSMSKASGGADGSEKNADNTDSVLRSQR